MLKHAFATILALSVSAQAQTRPEIAINDSGVQPENLTSSADGSVYFGSTAKGTIYRAAPGATLAEPWILASTSGLTNVLGVLADDKSNTLWVCQNPAGGRGAPPSGQAALRSFDLKTGAAKGTFPLPPNAGICNDIAVSADGSAYVAESFRGRVHRLRPGGSALEVWITDATAFNAVDGVAVLADGAVYVNDFNNGRLFRIPVNPDGSAGAIVPIEASMPSRRPDGLRAVGPQTLLQAEGQGRLTELTITGNRAEVRVLQEMLPGATGVTLVGDTAFVLVSRTRAVAVPYGKR
jgi:sugar lactone lactonase YvrE